MPTNIISGYVVAYDFPERGTRHFLSRSIPSVPIFTGNIAFACFTEDKENAERLLSYYPTSEDGFFACRILKAQQEVNITLE